MLPPDAGRMYPTRSRYPRRVRSNTTSGRALRPSSVLRLELRKIPTEPPSTRIRCWSATGENVFASHSVSTPAGCTTPSGSRNGASTCAVTHVPDAAARLGAEIAGVARSATIAAVRRTGARAPRTILLLIAHLLARTARDPWLGACNRRHGTRQIPDRGLAGGS